MPVDLDAAERFILANARLLDRHRAAWLLHGGSAEPVVRALGAYRNPDGGFGHALEPDVRSPYSEPASTLQALEVLAEVGRTDDPMMAEAVVWIDSISDSGGVPFVMPTAAEYPHAPWMVSSGEASFLTFPLAARLWEAKLPHPWLAKATRWCWTAIDGAGDADGYWVKFALDFLDHVPDAERAEKAIEALRPAIGDEGFIPVPGGTENERITPVTLSPHPGSRSRALFTEEQIHADLDRLEDGQQLDGGWTFDFLAWSEGQSVEWRGIVTLAALKTLDAHGRIRLPRSG